MVHSTLTVGHVHIQKLEELSSTQNPNLNSWRSRQSKVCATCITMSVYFESIYSTTSMGNDTPVRWHPGQACAQKGVTLCRLCTRL